MSITRSSLSFALMVSLAACGGASESTESTETTSRPRTRGGEAPPPNDGAAFSGLMGSISQDAVHRALEPRMPRFARCFAEHMGEVDFLGGTIRMDFRIHVDGTVAWVFPDESNVGHRAVESCIVEVARTTRFSAPRGGEAEFNWGFTIEAPDDVRTPVGMGDGAVSSLVAGNAAALLRSCGAAGGFRITAYVAPGGRVMAAGAATTSEDAARHLDCVTQGVAAWTFPDPGSYAGKVSFSL